MASKAKCIDCGTVYDVRRLKLGYPMCLDCGQAHAEQEQSRWCIAPVAHKQGATLVRRKTDLLGLNKYMGEV